MENKSNLKELWRTFKPLGITTKGEGNLKYHLKRIVRYFCKVFSNLADSLLQILRHSKNKFGIKITEDYYE